MTRWLCVLGVVAACGGSSADEDDEVPTGTPQPTDVGTPIGAPTTAVIGPEGGMLVAEGATLIVPAGALATATELSIQPITNRAWTSPGGAYRLTPDGITFAVPVELQLAYDPAALEGSAPGFLSIAYQNGDGFWAVLTSSVDTAQQHVGVALTHFTDYATVEGMRIVPDADRLRLDERTFVRLNLCFDLDGTAEPLMYPCIDASTSSAFSVGEFVRHFEAEVNGVLDGDLISGTIASSQQTKWEYDAPRNLPPDDKNPVAFSVPALTLPGQLELLVTHITILGDEDVWAGTAELTLEYTGPAIGFTNVKVTRANVTWTLDESLGAHVPSGTVEYTETGERDNSPNPPCTVFASYTGPIDPTSSSLVVNVDTYAGIGIEINVPVTRVDSCEGTMVMPTQLIWMPSKQGTIEDDETTIMFSESSPAGADTTQTVTYEYTKQP